MGSKKKRKWTVFFLIKSVGGNMPEVIRMINDIRCLELKAHVNVIVCLHFYRENLTALLKGDVSLLPVEIPDPTLTTMFFRLLPLPAGTTGFSHELYEVLEERDFDITNPVHLEKYFRQQVLLPFKAKHYILFSWDHGRAYGMFSLKFTALHTLKRTFEPVCNEEAKILTMEELAWAIRCTFGKKKVDVAIMMNCYMQFFDAGYALRHSVKYLVAPEGHMDFEGYNYHYLFQVLNNDEHVTPRKIARLAVKSFASKVYTDVDEEELAKNSTALFATDLRYYDSLAEQIEVLANILLQRLATDKEAIVEARDNGHFLAVGLLDFYHFTRQMAAQKLLSENFLCASRLLSIRDLVVIQSHIGKKIEKPNSGFSIFFPMAGASEIPREGFDDFFETAFMKDSTWKMLIEACAET
ncbi:clostripain-related cysteine peptidase [Dawidia soli]|uniref:Uncharacterized protein n=1 Tax=Dawidia soli TaxID=2782352 RepID=A0AAP2GE98_9BACT|nr:clostripain-related cysteine peptidase [Dawidia soli]MBT1688132.1 hypothetical protein [Dawidia soli]